MTHGTLRIRTPDGQTREVALQPPGLSVGRAPDNDVVLDEPSVSRRHARLSAEGGRLLVEDLGSANGTFAGGERLAANTPTPVSPGAAVRLGDVEVEYVPPAAAPPALSAAAPAAAGPPVQAWYSAPPPPIVPGRVASATLTLHNRGPEADEVTLTVAGLPDGWVRLSRDRVPLAPAGQDQVVLTFQAPPGSAATAGQHPFSIIVTSGGLGVQLTVSHTLVVRPVFALRVEVQPDASQRDFEVTLRNDGNTPVMCALSGRDDEHALDYAFEPNPANVAPGQARTVALKVKPGFRPHSEQQRAFEVVAEPTQGEGGPVTAAGILQLTPAQGVALTLQPEKSRRDFQVLAHNPDTAPVRVRLRGADEAAGLDYRFQPDEVDLAGGERAVVRLRVTPVDRPRDHAARPFEVVASPVDDDGDETEARARGEVLLGPVRNLAWLWVVLAIAALLLCALALSAGYLALCPTLPPGAPFCSAAEAAAAFFV